MHRRSMHTWSSQADATTHLTTLVETARCGLPPKFFWWMNVTIVAVAETLQVVREKACEQNTHVINLCKTLGRCSATDVVVAKVAAIGSEQQCFSSMSSNDMAHMRPSSSDAAGPKRMSDKRHWGAMQVTCEDCGSIYRRSNRSYHLKSIAHVCAIGERKGVGRNGHECGEGQHHVLHCSGE